MAYLVLDNWWYGLGDIGAGEGLIVPAAAGAIVPQIRDAGSAQVEGLRRRTVCG